MAFLGRTGREMRSNGIEKYAGSVPDPSVVMAGLVPAIHVFLVHGTKDVDARVKPGHDEKQVISARASAPPN